MSRRRRVPEGWGMSVGVGIEYLEGGMVTYVY